MEKKSFKIQLENLVNHPENHTYLLAVSGGADSMVLLSLFASFSDSQKEKLQFQVAHINYKLRGNDSDLDQKTVQDFCIKNHIKFHLYEVSEIDNKPENSIQLWARELRYTFFKKIQEEKNIEFLVTAHHLNDQLETFIINLSKASGIKGLSGIPSADHKILRPLLPFTKEEVYQFAKENSIVYREDLSNKKSDYLRNKIRHEIVPKLLETNDHFLANFKKSSSYLNQAKDFIQEQIESIENGLTLFNKDHKILSKEKLSKESTFVKFEILKKYGFNQEEEISKIFKAENGSSFFTKEYQLIITREELILVDSNEKTAHIDEIILTDHLTVSEDHILINLKGVSQDIDEMNRNLEWDFDAEKITFPLKLRRKKEGDLFFPIKMTGTKKISKFLRDEKLSFSEKEKIWILCDSHDHILGIVPYRQDRRYSTSKHTQKVVSIQWIDEQQIH